MWEKLLVSRQNKRLEGSLSLRDNAVTAVRTGPIPRKIGGPRRGRGSSIPKGGRPFESRPSPRKARKKEGSRPEKRDESGPMLDEWMRVHHRVLSSGKEGKGGNSFPAGKRSMVRETFGSQAAV